tara:strand:+ start:132 stop:395 length:264 start_codon:yes stop_codon:yes gene_type:complete
MNMIKNFIIIVQFFIIFSLMVQKPENLNVLVHDAATAKKMVIDGADYLHETFDREFEVHTEEEFKKEHGDKDQISMNIIQEWDIYEK